MSDPVRCDGCGAHGRRRIGRAAPEGWLYLEATDEENADDTLIVFACSRTCADRQWKDGPGKLDLRANPPPTMPESTGGGSRA